MRKSRPILSFSPEFCNSARPELVTVKGLLEKVFGVEEGHAKTNAFYDHVISFSFADDRIWYRNYEIVEEAVSGATGALTLREVGPRFCMQLVKIHQRSFAGPATYNNPLYQSPNEARALAKKELALKYNKRVEGERVTEEVRERLALADDPLDKMFQ